MYKEAFEKLELEDIATILEEVNPHFDGLAFDPVQTTILSWDIPFYEGYRFLDIADHTAMPPLQRFAIYKPGEVIVLDFTNEPIYALNQKAPVHLTEGNIEDYIRFFFTYVRGRHGRFLIVENVDDIAWKEDPPPAARKAIAAMMCSISLKEIGEDGVFDLEVCMIFKDSLFKSKVSVDPKGFVKLSNEELLIEDMPVLDDTLGQ